MKRWVLAAALFATLGLLTVSGVRSASQVPSDTPKAKATPATGGPVNIGGVAYQNLAQFVATGRRCGTDEPNDLQINTTRAIMDQVRQNNAGVNIAEAIGRVQIPVCLHIIHKGLVGDLTTDQINRQIAELNRSYNGSGFDFLLKSVDRTDVADPAINKPRWFTMTLKSRDEREAKRKLGIDPSRNLNLYTANLGGGILGWATFPSELDGDEERDGVVILHSSFPGGSSKPFDLGRTTVHEVGHWLGLFHTFQGGCASPGDDIDDTPQQADGPGKFLCDDALDTCPEPGKDPVHNYMNYSPDACMTEFTPGQIARIKLQVTAFRLLLISSGNRAGIKISDAGVVVPPAATP